MSLQVTLPKLTSLEPKIRTLDVRGLYFPCLCNRQFKDCKLYYPKTRLGRITWHLDHNYNYDEACWGKRGRGKSNCELKTAYLLQPDFNEDRQVIYDLTKFFEVARRVTSPRHVLVMDEGAIDMGNRASATLFGQLFNKRQQTIRYKQIISLWCLPNIQLLDLNQRRMLTGIVWLFDDNRGRGEYEEPIEARDGDIYIRPYPKPPNWDVRFPQYPVGFPWPGQDQSEIPGGRNRPPIENFHFTPIPETDPRWCRYMKRKIEHDKMLEKTLEEQIDNLDVNSRAAIKGSAYKNEPETATANAFADAIANLPGDGQPGK